jgi:hypothetical protein
LIDHYVFLIILKILTYNLFTSVLYIELPLFI